MSVSLGRKYLITSRGWPLWNYWQPEQWTPSGLVQSAERSGSFESKWREERDFVSIIYCYIKKTPKIQWLKITKYYYISQVSGLTGLSWEVTWSRAEVTPVLHSVVSPGEAWLSWLSSIRVFPHGLSSFSGLSWASLQCGAWMARGSVPGGRAPGCKCSLRLCLHHRYWDPLGQSKSLAKSRVKVGTTQEREYQEVWFIVRARSAKWKQNFVD